MKIGNKFKSKFEKAMASDSFWINVISMSFVNKIFHAMKDKGINYKQLAELTDSKPSRITKIMKGEDNITIKTMYKLAKAVEYDLSITIKPKSSAWNTNNILHLIENKSLNKNSETGLISETNSWTKPEKIA